MVQKKPLLQKLKENREQRRKTAQTYKDAYNEAYGKEKMASLKERAKEEARAKHRPTRGQKVDNILKGIENLGGGLGGTVSPRAKSTRKQKTGGKKKKYAVIDGKAYEIGGTTGSRITKPRKKKKSSDPFDLGSLDDIGDSF